MEAAAKAGSAARYVSSEGRGTSTVAAAAAVRSVTGDSEAPAAGAPVAGGGSTGGGREDDIVPARSWSSMAPPDSA